MTLKEKAVPFPCSYHHITAVGALTLHQGVALRINVHKLSSIKNACNQIGRLPSAVICMIGCDKDTNLFQYAKEFNHKKIEIPLR